MSFLLNRCATFLSSVAIGARVTLHSMPSLSTLNTAIIQIFIEPLLSTLLYLLLSGLVGAARLDRGSIITATLASVLGSCSISTSLIVSETLAWDRFEGTVPYVVLSSHVSWPLWFGRIGALMGVNLASNIVTLILTLALVAPSSFISLPWGAVLVLILAALLSSIGFGVVIAAISMLMSDIYTIPNILSSLLPIIGGMIAPVTVFPVFMQNILAVLPIVHITQAARHVTGHTHLALSSAGIAVLGGLCWAIIGGIVWSMSIKVQRQRGTITNIGI